MEVADGRGAGDRARVSPGAERALDADDELRRRAIALRLNEHRSTIAIGRELGKPPSTIYRWLRAAGVDTTLAGLRGGRLTASQAARRFGVNRHTLVDAAAMGRVRSERIMHGRGPGGLEWLFDEDELAEDLDQAPRCQNPGCDRLALGSSGGCEHHGHVFAGGRAQGVKRPDIGPKISAAKTGKPRPDVALRFSALWLGTSRPDIAALVREQWRVGGRSARALLEARAGGSARRRWKGRWASTKPPAPGGRPRGRPRNEPAPELVELVESYAARGWGYRTILAAAEVRAAGGSEDLVRRLVAEYRARVDDRQPTLFPRS